MHGLDRERQPVASSAFLPVAVRPLLVAKLASCHSNLIIRIQLTPHARRSRGASRFPKSAVQSASEVTIEMGGVSESRGVNEAGTT